ncbi:unnamed protein product [Didymodactylos carnosus]|uniref:Uncharacterized protein n=1 Tax=Didymodactylos carnosus TaxID=1234261 RepID=A0A8S2GEQ3_9BILA|nr:unnamed protein product [Didymodactylos carnosus]CAF3898293.1 unnamed protein product [Didymodactylos carnosus]
MASTQTPSLSTRTLTHASETAAVGVIDPQTRGLIRHRVATFASKLAPTFGMRSTVGVSLLAKTSTQTPSLSTRTPTHASEPAAVGGVDP